MYRINELVYPGMKCLPIREGGDAAVTAALFRVSSHPAEPHYDLEPSIS